MAQTMMEQAGILVKKLEEITGVSGNSIRKDDMQVLSLFQNDSEINRTIGLSMIPMFETSYARQIILAAKPESYDDVRKLRVLVNDGSEWAYTTLDMLRNGLIGLKDVLADKTDIVNFAKENGLPAEMAENIENGRYLMERETAEKFTDITWKLSYYKIHFKDIYEANYREHMADFYLEKR